MEKGGFILIGKIVKVHGLKGAVKVYSYCESTALFEESDSVLVVKNSVTENIYTINWIKPAGKTILLSLQGINNRTQAENIVGCNILIEKEKLPQLDDGDYYWFEIIGLNVFTIHDKHIGRVKEIIPTGSNDVYVAEKDGKETLIPALESVVVHIDINAKKMRVDLPEGI